MHPDFHCQVCDRGFERIKLPGNHHQRKRICEPCREWFVWCNKCKRAKLRSEFDRHSKANSGVQSKCRSCRIEAQGLIKVRVCGYCAAECVVRDHQRYNGRALWLCDGCYVAVKHCKSCDQFKPVDDFNKSGDKRVGRHAHCKVCLATRWSASDHENRTRSKRARFGLSYDAYLAMCVEQGNRCAICGEAETDVHQGTRRIRELAIDHDHSTGAVRALLCGKCNKAIGLMRDNPDLMRAAALYLESFAAQRIPGEV